MASELRAVYLYLHPVTLCAQADGWGEPSSRARCPRPSRGHRSQGHSEEKTDTESHNKPPGIPLPPLGDRDIQWGRQTFHILEPKMAGE